MKTTRMAIIMTLAAVSLSASAQSQYSGVAGASPNLVKKNSGTVRTKTVTTVTTTTTTRTTTVPTPQHTKTTTTENPDSSELQARHGLKEFGKGVSTVAKREWKTLGEATRKVGQSGKKFFKKLGKGISDSFKKDSVATK